jgi:hypothetical protein
MSLRDWFAGQAMMCIDGSKVPEYELRRLFGERGGITSQEIISAMAYDLADAMLKRRSQ